MVMLKKKPAKQFYYRIRTTKQKGNFDQPEYLISKLNGDFEPLSSYAMYHDFNGRFICQCPSRKRPCKHEGFFKLMRDKGLIDSEYLLAEHSLKFIKLEQIL